MGWKTCKDWWTFFMSIWLRIDRDGWGWEASFGDRFGGGGQHWARG
ncbi:MAG: hypothetical protein M2R45_05451 [Verrucomicrobia subdivision 3 bacterium]|nr:hypothetical protein [Limisphaerales bacterium]MCS1417875.1 hypothetical protein [Limisphaerales bacterium]